MAWQSIKDNGPVVLGVLILLVSTTFIIVSLSDKAKIEIDLNESNFYVNESNDWVLSGTEINKIYVNGSLLELDIGKTFVNDSTNIDENYSILSRTQFFINSSCVLTDVYEVNGSVEEVDLFPVNHTIILKNCSGVKYRYVLSNIDPLNQTGVITSPLNLGHRMRLNWEGDTDNQYIDNETVYLEYVIDSNEEQYQIRLFDPPTTRYVAISGSDANPGTEAQPYRTVKYAMSQAVAGDTISIGSGQFQEKTSASSSLLVSKALIFIGNGSTETTIVLVDTTVSYGFLVNVPNVEFHNFTLLSNSYSINSSSDWQQVGIGIVNGKHNVTIKGITFDNSTQGSLYISIANSNPQNNITVLNSKFINSNATNIIDLEQGTHSNLSIINNTFYMGYVNTQIGISQDTGGQTAQNGSILIQNNTFYTVNQNLSFYSTAIYLDSNYSYGYMFSNISNNRFGNNTSPFRGKVIRTKELNNTIFNNNNITFNNSLTGRDIIQFENINNNITVQNNLFCDLTHDCDNGGGAKVIVSESSSNVNISNNTGYFRNVADVFWTYASSQNVTNIYLSNNYIVVSDRTNTLHVIGVGEEGLDATTTTNGTIYNNTVILPGTGNYAEHSIFLGYCTNCQATFNTVIGGEYGLATKGNTNAILTNNTLINNTLHSIYNKWGTNNTYSYNTIIGNISGLNVVKIGQSGGTTTNTTFTYNLINISTTTNTTTGLYQDSTNNGLISNFNTWHFPYYEFNQSFLNGSTYMNWTTWKTTESQDLNSTFYPQLNGCACTAGQNNVYASSCNMTSPCNLTGYNITLNNGVDINLTTDWYVSCAFFGTDADIFTGANGFLYTSGC